MFVRAGQAGLMYDFFLYSGKNSQNKETGSCEKVVLRLCEGLPRQQNFKMCFDNWFCTMPLLLTMQSLGIPTTATVRANRLAGCSLKSDKELMDGYLQSKCLVAVSKTCNSTVNTEKANQVVKSQ